MRNRRIKHFEKTIRRTQKNIRELETDIADLHEENSSLRLLLEEQQDYIKMYTKEFRAETELLREGLQLLVENAKITGKNHLLLMHNANRTEESLTEVKKTLIGTLCTEEWEKTQGRKNPQRQINPETGEIED